MKHIRPNLFISIILLAISEVLFFKYDEKIGIRFSWDNKSVNIFLIIFDKDISLLFFKKRDRFDNHSLN